MKALLPALVLALPAAADPLDDRAIAVFSTAYADACLSAFLEDGALIEAPARFSMISASTWNDEPAATEVWLFRCNLGAYNMQSVLIGWTEPDGVRPLSVARPDLDIVHEVPGDFDSPVVDVRIVGWSASAHVVNAEVDAGAGLLHEHAYWRGIGDASSSATWRLVDGEFRLLRYAADATYDGEINPVTLVQFD